MFQLFNHENVIETLNKKPLICYYSENGACGPSGLLIVVFDDESSYGYSTYYDNYDRTLIKDISEYIPEMKGLLFYNSNDYQPKRASYSNVMELVNLGLGNVAYIHQSIYSDDLECNYPEFVKLVSKTSNVDMKEMYNQVVESLKR